MMALNSHVYTKLKLHTAALLCCMMMGYTNHAGANQNPMERKITLSVNQVAVKDVLLQLEEMASVKFVFSPSRLNLTELTSISVTDTRLEDLLKSLLMPRGISWSVKDNRIILSDASETIKRGDPREENAQSKLNYKTTITGTVIDATTNQALAGVNVIVKGTVTGTSTDADGKYSLQAADNATLVFSFIGYKSIEVNIAARSIVDVILEEDITSFNTVIINAGYYNVKEREATGSIVKVTSDVIERQPVTNPLAALQGRMTGVQIQQTGGVPGSDFKIEIRGRNSLRRDGNQPLYIVDGVPFSTQKVSSGNNASGVFGGSNAIENSGASPITSINQADIESIEILKDADATAIYGSRGANGVVLITTKKGKSGKTSFDLNIYSGVGIAPHVAMLNTAQYIAMRKQAFANDGIEPNVIPGSKGYAPDLTIWDTTRFTNWQKELMTTAQSTSIQSTLSGGSSNTQFLISTGFRKESSVVPGDFAYQKGSFHASINHQSQDRKFTLTFNVSGTKDKNHQPRIDNTSMARFLPPNAPSLYDENGNLNWENSTWTNPLAGLNNQYTSDVINFIGNTTVGHEIAPRLQFKTNIGINYLWSDEVTKQPSTVFNPADGRTSAVSYVAVSNGRTQSWIVEPQLSWDKEIGKGKLILFAGATLQDQIFNRKADSYIGFPSNSLLDNLAAATQSYNWEIVQSQYRYAAVFGRINYNWQGKYIVNLTARRDGSSRFGPGSQFANFGAIGASWIFSNESFIRDNISALSFGKLRASYGITGNDQIGDYQYFDTYTTTSAFANKYGNITTLNPTKLFNPNYAWETNKKIEASIDLAFFNDRIAITVSHYRNHSSNQLVNYTLPMTTGFTGILANLPATVLNTGWEIELKTTNIDRVLNWTTSFNITVPKNKLTAFPNIESSTYANTYTVGESIYMQRKFEYIGVDPQSGLYSFTDFNGDGSLSFPEDNKKSVFVGQFFFGGINNSISHKNISLDILFQLVKQNGIQVERFPGTSNNFYAFLSEKVIWRQPGDIADYQRLATDYNSASARAVNDFKSSDGAIGDASFIRLKNVSLSWQLPKKWVGSLKTRLYFQGQNLLTLTGFEGGDPETQYGYTLPPLRVFTAGVRFTL